MPAQDKEDRSKGEHSTRTGLAVCFVRDWVRSKPWLHGENARGSQTAAAMARGVSEPCISIPIMRWLHAVFRKGEKNCDGDLAELEIHYL